MPYAFATPRSEEIANMGRSAKGFLVYWDGCCALGNTLVPEAADFLRANQTRTAIVSNNSTCTPDDFLHILACNEIQLERNQVILAGMEALKRATGFAGAKVMVLGDPHMRGTAKKMGIDLTQEAADVVVLLRDVRFTYRRLERAVNSLSNGGHLIVANPDQTHPGKDGGIKPETGALLAAIRACVKLDETKIDVVGKPSPHLFQMGCQALDLSPDQVVMLGDNPATDLAGANALGIKAVLTSAKSPDVFEILLEAL